MWLTMFPVQQSAFQTRSESIALGSSARRRQRPEAFDEFEFDADDPVDVSSTTLFTDDDEFELVSDIGTIAPRRAQPHPLRKRARSPKEGKALKPARAALSDDDLDPADEWEAPERDRDRDRKRVEVSEPFKCRHCRAFVGIPPTGGRNRNHCPLCLYSLHVDGKTPGDRASDCRSSMAPVGTFYRPNLEQVVVHRCLGCGFVRYNRVAADDNPIVLAQLPVMSPDDLAAAAGDDA
jgi:hypothetical protein